MKSRNIYTGRIVTLNVESGTLPNGARVDLETIRHPGAAAVVPMKDEGTVVLIHQFRYAAGGFIYEIPAGTLHQGEDPLACAARELEEEVGYRATSWEHLTSILPAPGYTDEVIHIYQATGLTKSTQTLDHDEVLEIVEMPIQKAIAHIRDGTIRDGKTIIGLQAVFLRSREG